MELGTGRAAMDCLARFQRELNPELLRRPWTLEEEARLTAAVEKHGRQWAVRRPLHLVLPDTAPASRKRR